MDQLPPDRRGGPSPAFAPDVSKFDAMAQPIRSADRTSTHLTEIAEILALGLQRHIARKSSLNSPPETDSPLDCERVFGRDETGNFEESER